MMLRRNDTPHRAVPAIAFVLISLAACDGADLPVMEARDYTICSTWRCGYNTSEVNGKSLEELVKQDDIGGYLPDLVGLSIVRALRRGDEQAQYERGDRADQARPQSHDILRIVGQMVSRQRVAKKRTDEHAAEDDRERDQEHCDGTHDLLPHPDLLRGVGHAGRAALVAARTRAFRLDRSG